MRKLFFKILKKILAPVIEEVIQNERDLKREYENWHSAARSVCDYEMKIFAYEQGFTSYKTMFEHDIESELIDKIRHDSECDGKFDEFLQVKAEMDKAEKYGDMIKAAKIRHDYIRAKIDPELSKRKAAMIKFHSETEEANQ